MAVGECRVKPLIILFFFTVTSGFNSRETDVTPIIAGSVVGVLFLSVVFLTIWYMKKIYPKKQVGAAPESQQADG